MNFIKKKKNKLSAGSFYLKSENNALFEKLSYGFFNLGFFITQYFSPTACGSGMFSKKNSFNKIGGFRENINLCEDCDFAKDIKNKNLKFRMIPTKIIFSNRILDKKGHFSNGFLDIKANIYRFISRKPYKTK